MSIGIFYDTVSGSTKLIAYKIKDLLNADIFRIDEGIDEISSYNQLIFITPTFGLGELPDNFEENFDKFSEIDFTDKKVALVGTGDAITFSDSFCDAIGIIGEVVEDNGGEIYGRIDSDGYLFTNSRALDGFELIGLCLDKDNEPEKTDERIANWIESLKNSW